jgi:hypothetical protein
MRTAAVEAMSATGSTVVVGDQASRSQAPYLQCPAGSGHLMNLPPHFFPDFRIVEKTKKLL